MHQPRYVIQIETESGEFWSYPMQDKEQADGAERVLSGVRQLDIRVSQLVYENNGYNMYDVFIDVGKKRGFADEIYAAYAAYRTKQIAEQEALEQTLDDACNHIKEMPL